MREFRGLGCLLASAGLLYACTNTVPKDPAERSSSEIYMLKGVQYMEKGRMDIAMQDISRAIELDDRNVEAYNAMGVLRDRLNQPDLAEEQFKKALSLDKSNASVANNYGRLLCSQGKYEQGMKYFSLALEDKLYKSPWLALTNAGLCAKSAGQNAEGESFLRKALEAEPNFPPALLEMAKISLAGGNAFSARAFLQRFESVVDPTPESLLLGAQTETALGNAKDADAYLKKLQRLYPDSKEALRARKSHSAD